MKLRLREARGELARCISRHADTDGDRPAYILSDGRRVSYAALASAVQSCAQVLSAHGVGPGHRVAILVGDHPGFPAWYAGVQGVGAVPCPVPVRMTSVETSRALAALKPCCAVVDEAVLEQSTVPPGSVLTLVTSPWTGGEASLTSRRLPRSGELLPPSSPAEVASVHLTYRGVGRPLGVVHGHLSHQSAAKSFCEGTGLTAGDRVLGMLPFAHIFSFTSNLLAPLRAGATLVLAHGRPHEAVLELIHDHRPRVAFMVPAQARYLAEAQQRTPRDLACLDRIWCGGAPFGQGLVEQFSEATGARLLQGYGLTEAFVVSANPYRDHPARPETLGLPFPGYKVRITNPTGQELPDGEEGELEVSGDAVFSGYLDDPETSAEALRDGWLRTGDRAFRCDDGHIVFCGWSKRIIKTLGHMVDVSEVEDVLCALPGVGRVLLEAEPHPTRGFVLRATLTAAPEGIQRSILAEELGRALSFYKIPRLTINNE